MMEPAAAPANASCCKDSCVPSARPLNRRRSVCASLYARKRDAFSAIAATIGAGKPCWDGEQLFCYGERRTHAIQASETLLHIRLPQAIEWSLETSLAVEYLRLQPHFCEVEGMLKYFRQHARRLRPRVSTVACERSTAAHATKGDVLEPPKGVGTCSRRRVVHRQRTSWRLFIPVSDGRAEHPERRAQQLRLNIVVLVPGTQN